eukprot:COSAG02_NODE_1088_length_14670_cov_237.088326_8_plen_169_part_00
MGRVRHSSAAPTRARRRTPASLGYCQYGGNIQRVKQLRHDTSIPHRHRLRAPARCTPYSSELRPWLWRTPHWLAATSRPPHTADAANALRLAHRARLARSCSLVLIPSRPLPEMAAKGLDMSKIFDTTLNTPQTIVCFLVMLYVFGGMYFVLSTNAAKAAEKKEKKDT